MPLQISVVCKLALCFWLPQGQALLASTSEALCKTKPDKTHVQYSGFRPLKEIHLAQEEGNLPQDCQYRISRPTRRLNNSFRYLYRHDVDANNTSDAFEYLTRVVGYSLPQVKRMSKLFPPLLTLSVRRQLVPKMQFLCHTLQIDPQAPALLETPQYFGSRLERTLAPRHAFLVYNNLPHGPRLLQTPEMWRNFLMACRHAKHFAAFCQSLQSGNRIEPFDAKQVEAFDALFSRGLMASARGELVQSNNTWPFQYIDLQPAQLVDLLIQHGANPRERDHRGVTLLHWACGAGQLDCARILLPYTESGVWTSTERDGATPLHWAAAGAAARSFGCGGHVGICRFLLDQVANNRRAEYVQQRTYDGNSALMWAAWSGTLETVKFLIRERANQHETNRNGCSVAHWAASGGSVDVCQYLASIGVDFMRPNYGGNTPLTHAVAFGRTEVVAWLRNECAAVNDAAAMQLAQDFVNWDPNDDKRQHVFSLLSNDDYDSEHDAVNERTIGQSGLSLELLANHMNIHSNTYRQYFQTPCTNQSAAGNANRST